MSAYELILVPEDPRSALPAPDEFRDLLASLGLIAETAEEDGSLRCVPGARFHELIRFSSSHRIVVLGEDLTPESEVDSRTRCIVEITSVRDRIRFLGGAGVEDPSCRDCGFRLVEWGDMVSAWWEDPDGHRWQCPVCSAHWWPWELDWRHSNGFGRFWIAVSRVFWHEATPDPELLDTLRDFSGPGWTYFYREF